MSRRLLVLVGSLFGVAACSAGGQSVEPPPVRPDLQPKGATVEHLPVDRVVDGDTVRVLLDGQSVSVRLIGINSPESVKPGSPVECYGPEASEFAKDVLTGGTVTLEYDDSQGRTDRYDRMLAYVWRELPDGSRRLFNLEAVSGGYAEERQYGSQPYAWRAEFSDAEDDARAADLGMWGACDRS